MKGKELALIFDVGTQATRALVFDTAGDLVFVAKQNGELYISDGDQRAEADCESIWRDMCKVSLQAKEKLGERWKDIAAEEAQAGAGDAERENAPAKTENAGEGVNAVAQEQATEMEPEEKAAAQTESDE